MSENGYIRKIDELGRIVIPKEVRKKLKIHEGENLLINCSENNIHLSKHSYIKNNHKFINHLGDKTHFLTNLNIIITDLENIIYSSNKHEQIPLSEELKTYITSRISKSQAKLLVGNNLTIEGNIQIEPIISNSFCLGLVITYNEKENEYINKIAKLLASIISIYVDES